jgi:hypothetical protein
MMGKTLDEFTLKFFELLLGRRTYETLRQDRSLREQKQRRSLLDVKN